jgi:hypothetical protein
MRTVLKFHPLLPFKPTDVQKSSCFLTTVSLFWSSPSTCHAHCFIHVYCYIRNKVTVTCFCCRSDWRQRTSGSSSSKRIAGGPWQARTTRTSGACYDKYSYNAWSKVMESCNRPGVVQRVPGGLGSQISWHSAHEGGEVVSLMHLLPLPPGNVPGTHFR